MCPRTDQINEFRNWVLTTVSILQMRQTHPTTLCTAIKSTIVIIRMDTVRFTFHELS